MQVSVGLVRLLTRQRFAEVRSSKQEKWEPGGQRHLGQNKSLNLRNIEKTKAQEKKRTFFMAEPYSIRRKQT